jgi:hypothetical protein
MALARVQARGLQSAPNNARVAPWGLSAMQARAAGELYDLSDPRVPGDFISGGGVPVHGFSRTSKAR